MRHAMGLEATAPLARQKVRGAIVALQLLVGAFLAIRLYYDINGDLLGDDAYYWMWGQHLGWSYFDHPPLHAWLLRVVSLFAPWHPFSVRLLTWVSLAGILAIFRAWAPRFAPEDPQLWFWRTAAIYLSSPLLFGMTMIAYNDHLLVFLSLLAVHCFVVFNDMHETGTPAAIRWLYLAAIALGLATLSKYNGGFVGLGFAATFLLRPGLRPLLRTPHPWLAGLLALAMQTPVVYWNLTEGLASAKFHLSDRWDGHAGEIHWLYPVYFILLAVILWSPFLVWPTIRMILGKAQSGFEDRAKTLTVSIFAISTLGLMAVALPLGAYFYWNIVAFAVLMPMLTRFVGKWLGRVHYVIGLISAGLIAWNFSVVPIGEMIGRLDHGSSINFGWSEIADHVRAAEAQSPTDLIGATRYSTTSQLGFVLGITNAVKLAPEHSQYDYWQDETKFAGKSALLLIDNRSVPMLDEYLKQHFAALTKVDEFTIVRLGHPIYRWELWRGEGFRP
jgi:hypothetical protein